MSYPQTTKGPAVTGQIDVSNPDEIKYWTQALGVSEHELQLLVAKYGENAANIRIQRAK